MQAILDFIATHPVVGKILSLLVNVLLAAVIAFLALRLSRKLFQKIRTRKAGISLQFTENIFRFLIIFISVMWIVMSSDLTRSFGESLFQSTAVIAAIAGFAAQSVLSDLICGMIITSTKPFEIGDRIELENGISGIVKDMTLRHVVLKGIDTQVYIVPNSKMNAQYVRNMSYRTGLRSVDFHFSVSYTTDPETASKVIRQAVIDSPYSVPGIRKQNESEAQYGQVYFVAFRDSCLDMNTTAYYKADTPTEVFKNDINTRVKKALEDHHIEIPYNYLNVVVGQRE